MPSPTTLARALLGAAITCLFLYDLHDLPMNADDAAALLAGDDMLHGNFFLSGWILPPDNFWLLDDLLYGVCARATGITPFLLYLVPALLLSCLVLLTLRAASLDRDLHSGGAMIIMTLLLFPPFFYGDALHFIANAPGHVSTLCCSLAALILLHRCLTAAPDRQTQAAYTALILLCSISDPFAAVILTGPALITLAAQTWIAQARIAQAGLPQRRRTCIVLILLTLTACLLAQLLLHELAHHGGFTSPPANRHLVPLTRLPANLDRFTRDILTIFGANFLQHGATSVPRLALLALALLAITRSAIHLRRTLAHNDQPASDCIAELYALGALMLCSAALLCSTYLVDVTSVRYVSPCLVFATLLLVRRCGSAPRLLPFHAAQLAASVALLLILPPATRPAATSPDNMRALADWLSAQHLTRGYAGHWNASIVTVYSHGHIPVRPVISTSNCAYDRFAWLSKAAWYNPPRTNNPVFFITNPTDPQYLSRNELAARLGPPLQTHRAGPLLIDLYGADQLAKSCPRHNARETPPTSPAPPRYNANREVTR